ncbi:MAG: HAMP domain-containing sensor histidine kinase [Verrucomicrobiota bacterium]
MFDFFSKLFDTSDFPARWNCGNWNSFDGWLHILSDIAIWGAYFMIPFALGYFWWSKRDELVFPRLLWLFAAFIFFCGTTHLIEAVIFYEPIYRISGLMKFITAVVSWMTVFAITRIGRAALELPGLARMSKELQEQLDRARNAEKQLEGSNHKLVEYTARVTHDLRNPLSGILLLAELARESAVNGDSNQAAKQLESMLGPLREMDNSMKELHRHSMEEKGRMTRTRIPLDEVLETVRNNLASELERQDISLVVLPLPEVMGNRILLLHLFTNLLDNAIKYRAAEPSVITIAAQRDETHEIITVTDNGRGVPETEREQIFEPDIRASNVLDQPGSGVGLSFCRSLMESHHGTIRVMPNVAQGTVIELCFPLVDPRGYDSTATANVPIQG